MPRIAKLSVFWWCWSQCDVTSRTLAMAAIVCWQSVADCTESNRTKCVKYVWLSYPKWPSRWVLGISMQWLRLKSCHVACDEWTSGEICSLQHMWVTGSVMWAAASDESLKFGVQGATTTNWFPRVNGAWDNRIWLYYTEPRVLAMENWCPTDWDGESLALAGLNSISYSLSHLPMLLMSCWRRRQSWLDLISFCMIQSSVNSLTLLCWAHCRRLLMKQDGPKHSALRDTGSHWGATGQFAFNEHSLGASREETLYPLKSVASDAKMVQLRGQVLVWHFVKRFGEIHDDEVSLDFAVAGWGKVVVQAKDLGFTWARGP